MRRGRAAGRGGVQARPYNVRSLGEKNFVSTLCYLPSLGQSYWKLISVNRGPTDRTKASLYSSAKSPCNVSPYAIYGPHKAETRQRGDFQRISLSDEL